MDNSYFLSKHGLAADSQQEARESVPIRSAAALQFGSTTEILANPPMKTSQLSLSSYDTDLKNSWFVQKPEDDFVLKPQQEFVLKPQDVNVERVKDVAVEADWAKTRVPTLEEMPVRCLRGPFNPLNAIVLSVPTSKDPTEFVRAAFSIVYSVFCSMAPEFTFHPNAKDLRCWGSYTAGFSTCSFAAQAWMVDPSFADDEQEYIFELRHTSQGGRTAFTDLVRHVALALKSKGFATEYANGCEIHQELSPVEDLGELSMPGFQRSSRGSPYPVTLNEEDVVNMTATITERKYPQYAETLELLAQCGAGSKENCEVLRENDELEKAIHHELSTGYDANTCHHALSLIEHGAIVPKDVLPAVARCLKVHSGYKQSAHKDTRSRTIECTALRVMDTLVCQKGEWDQEATMQRIEEELYGKLRVEVFRRVKDIRVRQAVRAY